ncbi:type IV toxin-antitoxin system AbiEi family antitoxin domain-containing protein [Bacteroides graminisolvens]|jgi:predicted transcriptional regulator of viral defense system|uniref:type IV toxin-antitoxin system AbiEi family antitoxin domain-containing protein n=1 Tax=Bacteroides graminisolvens TaxID=477666 RepID=UPI0023F05A5A|nr:type IV toxin-antitoxin system AbiEi family antitoxin domain-containing protein [Bacteroides graminisolvens]
MRIIEYIANNGGFISSADAKKASLYNQLLYETRTGRIVRVRRGVYAINDGLAKQMIDVETLVPGGVLCLYSAWSFHELTTQIPQAYNIAVERSRRITLPDFPPIELSFMSQKAYELGVKEFVVDGFKVKIYDLEKSVCDAIKYRNKIGLDVSSEIFKSYLSRKDRDITLLYEYASQLRVEKKIDELIKFML